MKRIVLSALVLGTALALGGSAFAEEPACKSPEAEWQPKEVLQQKLEADGWKVKTIKTNNGCYEVYGIDAKGNKMESYFDPKTFEFVGEED